MCSDDVSGVKMSRQKFQIKKIDEFATPKRNFQTSNGLWMNASGAAFKLSELSTCSSFWEDSQLCKRF